MDENGLTIPGDQVAAFSATILLTLLLGGQIVGVGPLLLNTLLLSSASGLGEPICHPCGLAIIGQVFGNLARRRLDQSTRYSLLAEHLPSCSGGRLAGFGGGLLFRGHSDWVSLGYACLGFRVWLADRGRYVEPGSGFRFWSRVSKPMGSASA